MNKKLRLQFFFFTNHQKTPLQKCYSLQGWGRGDWFLRLSLCVTCSGVLTDGFTENACGRTPDAKQTSRDVIHVTHATGRAIGPGERIHQPRKCYPVRIAQRHPGDSFYRLLEQISLQEQQDYSKLLPLRTLSGVGGGTQREGGGRDGTER